MEADLKMGRIDLLILAIQSLALGASQGVQINEDISLGIFGNANRIPLTRWTSTA